MMTADNNHDKAETRLKRAVIHHKKRKQPRNPYRSLPAAGAGAQRSRGRAQRLGLPSSPACNGSVTKGTIGKED